MKKAINNRKKLIRYLYGLGFVEKRRVGRKRHPNKLFHPTLLPNKKICPDQPPFIIIPYKVDVNQIQYILKELDCWQITIPNS